MKFIILLAIVAFAATCYAAPGGEAKQAPSAAAEDLDTAAYGWGGGYGGGYRRGGYGGYGGYGGGYGGYGGGYGGFGGGYGGWGR